jgi:hypothetical protein
MQISVRFDIDQISSHLDYSFKSSDESADPTEGRYTGGVFFRQGQHVYVDVTGSGSKASEFSSFQVIDCCIITKPKVTQAGAGIATRYSPPSPFLQSVGAAYPMALDYSSVVSNDAHGQYRHIRQDWKRSLNVAHTGGHWEISLVLTVRILRGDTAAPELRVFSFDPEGSVGGGSAWDTPADKAGLA